MKLHKLILITCCPLIVFSCNKKKTQPQEMIAPELKFIILKNSPKGAQSITEARKSAQVGKEVTISGKVMGRNAPFVNDRAILILGDPVVLTSCDLRPGDGCLTPWDNCCDEPEDIKASTAIVQVLDQEGRPIKHGLRGVAGIKELSELIVIGTVAKGSNKDNLVINTTGIYIQR